MSTAMLEKQANQKKKEFMEALKLDGRYLCFSEKHGFMYELIRPLAGGITRIIVSIKSGYIAVHTVESV